MFVKIQVGNEKLLVIISQDCNWHVAIFNILWQTALSSQYSCSIREVENVMDNRLIWIYCRYFETLSRFFLDKRTRCDFPFHGVQELMNGCALCSSIHIDATLAGLVYTLRFISFHVIAIALGVSWYYNLSSFPVGCLEI